jgi:mxaJ protein
MWFMSSDFRQALAALGLTVALGAALDYHMLARADSRGASQTTIAQGRGVQPQPLRVCADPNNLPYSNRREEGFENELAKLVAADLGRTVRYVWWPQRRGFFRQTLRAGVCDVVMSVPAKSFAMAEVTSPYYRSTYVFVTRRDHHLHIDSFDDLRLKRLRIGIHAVGTDYNNVPPAQALAQRGIIDNIHGYTIYGEYSKPNPPRELIDAVARGDVDVAVAWGPLAGYFAKKEPVALDIVPVRDSESTPILPMQFDIAMGVRKGDETLRSELQSVLKSRRMDIQDILARYDIPVIQENINKETERKAEVL